MTGAQQLWRREFEVDGPTGPEVFSASYNILTARAYLEHVAAVEAAEDADDDERHIEAVLGALGVMCDLSDREGMIEPADLPLQLIGEVYAAHPAFKSL
ncbi:hypothetical protein [Candidatus Poriferisocius sp.]|uniref:hypothetical protein n=1 Tax=Candidatus Poriferisocius sp. TaxID=3101276 RepID=UPI003B02C904